MIDGFGLSTQLTRSLVNPGASCTTLRPTEPSELFIYARANDVRDLVSIHDTRSSGGLTFLGTSPCPATGIPIAFIPFSRAVRLAPVQGAGDAGGPLARR